MNIFNLPDLGEGLPDAEIHEWFVNEGDTVTADQPLVSMETAKAVVDVPSPQSGTIIKLHGKPGDVIKTGEPLVSFEATSAPRVDKGTVVGNLEESTEISEDNFTIGSSRSQSQRSKTTPAVRLLAKKLGIDLNALNGSGEHGLITREDVQTAANKKAQLPEGYEALRGVRRAMLNSMVQSHQEIVPVSLFDEADISAWQAGNDDITVRLIRAIIYACSQEPALNAWFDTDHAARKCFKEVHLGIAMDNNEGLFVPVIHNAASCSDEQLRNTINNYKKEVSDRAVAPENLKGATITLSNFGKFAGRFASPIIVPPMVAILAVGRLYQGAVVANDRVEAHRLLPLSLSFDHRAVTGGEATRFLGAVIESLQKA
ncbi:Dihydrolipoyllysine-residue acetyltransferase component of pyruvate dehydrogenase complex [Legionella massiliensis]|uniref:Dihydrolipoamide acetyltransferase component of pyruvate dehydrogenase complex n=1 Tax=Legionella massiliensis TaxID=1034943 RepID=A0A078KZC3_9GAMM|nr:dihydrolipoamide acetyltransferase family protein [Legionella massiliensis]CDZ78271.1 Dihydrolipoyllysine-residue acetyltransferase component of pyruvate dehydrogenase complex [Legionella massiliensis]CEE14009.1 Dihydrolipoyllysine-residue acetyltransferase component of pyruvate dehydrogenase complex [Legionella massiliensis]